MKGGSPSKGNASQWQHQQGATRDGEYGVGSMRGGGHEGPMRGLITLSFRAKSEFPN